MIHQMHVYMLAARTRKDKGKRGKECLLRRREKPMVLTQLFLASLGNAD